MMSLIVGIGQQFLERPEAEQFVDQHLLQRELLATVEGDLQLGEHLADDRAEFLGKLVLGQRCGRLGVDAFEQARKHLLLDPVDRGFEAFAAACRRLGRASIRFWRRDMASPPRSGAPGAPKLSSVERSSIGGNCSPPSIGRRAAPAGPGPSSAWPRRKPACSRVLRRRSVPPSKCAHAVPVPTHAFRVRAGE